MPRKTYHVTKDNDGQRKGTLEGSQRASVFADTKAEALDLTADLARQAPLGQVLIHKENGIIQSERTYGKDPRRFPG
ncbi:MAG: DUF2188 domain-containing protein [Candidatus Omnitrophica bacterium]|nr:DUF2188 domain-containing protein [Candidatus Omnitrophota bacterium]